MTTIIPSFTQSHTSYRARDGTDAQVWGASRTQMILLRGPDNISTRPQRVDDSNRMCKEGRKQGRKKRAQMLLLSSTMRACCDEFWVRTYELACSDGLGRVAVVGERIGAWICVCVVGLFQGKVSPGAPRRPACAGPRRRGRHSHTLPLLSGKHT